MMTEQTEAPRFLADVMLGSLARWLRILGFDTSYHNRMGDLEIVRLSLLEGRLVLTRDSRLVKRRVMRNALLVETDDLGKQIRQVLKWSGQKAREKRLFCRCLACNAGLEGISREEAAGAVPPYVFRTQHCFRRCPICRRIYWAGTHREKVLRRLEHFEIRLV